MISHTHAEKFCQSCGMPMAKDSAGGATLKSGGTSKSICSLCMSDGEYHFVGKDVKAFQKMVVNEMVKKGWLRPVAWLLTRQIPSLKRWKV